MPAPLPSSLAAEQITATRSGALGRIQEASTAFEPGGAICMLLGPRGSGNNLLLRLLALMETPDNGEILLCGERTSGWDDIRRAETRNRRFGYIFEAPFLLPAFNVVENVAMPYFKLTDATPEEAEDPTYRVLEFMGLAGQAEADVQELPLEAQLRVALARALITNPMAVFIENLDSLLRDDALIRFLELLAQARDQFGTLFLVSAQTRELTAFGDRALEFQAGRLTRDWSPGGLLS